MQEFFVMDFQGYTPRKTERSPVLWACEIQGAQHKISMEKGNDFLVG